MTAIINASNTSGITFTSDTSGNLAMQSNGTTVATITGSGANAGIQMGAAFAPAFSATMSGNQTLTSGVSTKVQFNTEEFDTASCYDNVTNYRFTPTVAGYYQVNLQINANNSAGAAPTGGVAAIGKNVGGSSVYKTGYYTLYGGGTFNAMIPVSAIIYMNGTTDYIEAYATITAAGTPTIYSSNGFFQAALIRSA